MLHDTILKILQAVRVCAGSDYTLSDVKSIKKITVEDNVNIDLSFNFPIVPYVDFIKNNIMLKLQKLTDKKIVINIKTSINSHVVQKDSIQKISKVKNIIGVSSAKGGVGKSTVTANLAVALSQQGARVGILDADIYGPSQPKLFNIESEKPEVTMDKKFIPIYKQGIYIMSMGFLYDRNTPMVWRGPMISKALMQLLEDTNWPDLDYLLIDLPPGTGDIPLTLVQKVPLTGIVLVTTPQQLAVLDVRKSVAMLQKVNVKILGMVENMSMYLCPQCGHKEHIFMNNGGQNLADEFAIKLLAKIPLNSEICKQSDLGIPLLIDCKNSSVAKIYNYFALSLSVEIAKLQKNIEVPISVI